jgi:hypothetical protein
LCNLFKIILEEAFGSCLWYKRLLRLTAKINSESGYERTLPGLPLTGMWFNVVPKQEGVHCDPNAVGASFVLSTYEGDGAVLVFIHHITEKCSKDTNQPSNDFGRKLGQLRSL